MVSKKIEKLFQTIDVAPNRASWEDAWAVLCRQEEIIVEHLKRMIEVPAGAENRLGVWLLRNDLLSKQMVGVNIAGESMSNYFMRGEEIGKIGYEIWPKNLVGENFELKWPYLDKLGVGGENVVLNREENPFGPLYQGRGLV